MLRNIARTLNAVLLSATAVIVFSGQAQAATIAGTWDPAFGKPFDISGYQLGWRGEVNFHIPDKCLTPDYLVSALNQFKNVPTQPSNCAYGNDLLQLNWGLVTLYNMSTGKDIGTVTFGVSVFAQNDSVDVAKNGDVKSLVADFGVWVPSDPTSNNIVGSNAQYFLSFTGTCAQLRIKGFATGNNNNQGSSGNATSDDCTNSTGPFLTFRNLSAQVVPEPGSLALLLPAIGMLAGLRRRKPVLKV